MILSRKTGISKSIIAFATDLIGYNDLYTMITGKDAETGKPRSRWIGAAWTAFNAMPVSKVAKLAKVAKLLATAKKTEKVVKDGNRIRKASAAAKLAIKRAAEKKAKRKAEKAADRYANKAAKKLDKAAKKNEKALKKTKKAESVAHLRII